MSSKKINLLLTNSDGSEENLSFEKTELLVGASQVADIKVSAEGVEAIHCRMSLEDGVLKVDPADGGEITLLNEGDSFLIGEKSEFSLKFESYSSISFSNNNSTTVNQVLSSADKMLNSKSELADVEAEAENYLHNVRLAEARLSKASQDADLQFQSKLSQSSARAHRILEQTTKDIDSLTKEAQKKVHYLNHEIEEKSAQLHKTILFLESQTAQKQENLEFITNQMEELEYKKVSLKKDLKIKEQEFSVLQAEYTDLVNSKKEEVLHLNEDANTKRAELDEINEKLILEEKRFEEKSYILKKNITNIETEAKEKENLISVLKENYRNLEEDLEALNHDKEKLSIKIKEEEGILSVLQKKKELIKDETQRIIAKSKEEAMNVSKKAVLKAEELKRESLRIKETASNEAKEILAQANDSASRISRESKENAQKLIDVARVDAKQIISQAQAKLREAQLDYSNKLKLAESESASIKAQAAEAKALMLKEIEQKREEQLNYIDSELRRFKDGLGSKKADHIKLVAQEEEAARIKLQNEIHNTKAQMLKEMEEKQNEQNAYLKAEREKFEKELNDRRERELAFIKEEELKARERVKEDIAAFKEDSNNETALGDFSELVQDFTETVQVESKNDELKDESISDKNQSEAKAEEEKLKNETEVLVAANESLAKEESSENKDEVQQDVAVVKSEETKVSAASSYDEADALKEIPQAVAKIEDSRPEEVFTSVAMTQENVEKERVYYLKPLKEAFSNFAGSLKLVFSSKQFKIAVPAVFAVAVLVSFAPKLMTQIREQRAISAATNAKKEALKKSLAARADKEREASRDVSSIGSLPTKAVDVYHDSYTDRLLYTDDYMKNEFTSSYRSKWITEMRNFVIEKAKLPESQLAPIITTETALLRALDQMNKRSKNTDLMVKLEEQLLNKLKTQLKTEALYSEFFDMKEKFYKKAYPVK